MLTKIGRVTAWDGAKNAKYVIAKGKCESMFISIKLCYKKKREFNIRIQVEFKSDL